MSFCLVKWIEEDRLSVIPSTWVLQPDSISTTQLPVDGICYWRKKSSKHQTRIFSVSDTIKELEQQLMEMSKQEDEGDEEDEADEEEEPEEGVELEQTETNRRKRPLGEDSNKASGNTAKKRKEFQLAAKAKKTAEISSINSVAKEIFEKQSTSTPVFSYVQLEQQLTSAQNELRRTSLRLAESNSKFAELKDQVTDLKASVVVKKLMVEDLQAKVTELEEENISLKATSKQDSAPLYTGFPPASASEIVFLEKLLQFYSKNKGSQQAADFNTYVNNDESSEEDNDLCDLEKRRLTNIQRNERLLVELGLKKRCESVTKAAKAQHTKRGQQPALNSSTVQNDNKQLSDSEDLRTLSCGGYSYAVTASDLQKEQEAFQAGEGRKELVKDFGVYIKFIDLEQCEQSSKQSATGLMRSIISIFYSNERLAACSATAGINSSIRTAVFKYCELKFPGQITSEKLKRDLTSKCGEERRKIKKLQLK